MGTNFYTMDNKHIGKRSAAGVWCWDCRISLNDPVSGVYYRHQEDGSIQFTCPRCGKSANSKDLPFKPALRELGFDKSAPRAHSGVDGSCAFTWQVGAENCVSLGVTRGDVYNALKKRKFVKNEYGDKLTIQEFWDMFKDIILEREVTEEFS